MCFISPTFSFFSGWASLATHLQHVGHGFVDTQTALWWPLHKRTVASQWHWRNDCSGHTRLRINASAKTKVDFKISLTLQLRDSFLSCGTTDFSGKIKFCRVFCPRNIPDSGCNRKLHSSNLLLTDVSIDTFAGDDGIAKACTVRVFVRSERQNRNSRQIVGLRANGIDAAVKNSENSKRHQLWLTWEDLAVQDHTQQHSCQKKVNKSNDSANRQTLPQRRNDRSSSQSQHQLHDNKKNAVLQTQLSNTSAKPAKEGTFGSQEITTFVVRALSNTQHH